MFNHHIKMNYNVFIIVALCNNRPSYSVIKKLSHFVITLVALCNKLEIGGRRTNKPSNKCHHRQQQQRQ